MMMKSSNTIELKVYRDYSSTQKDKVIFKTNLLTSIMVYKSDIKNIEEFRDNRFKVSKTKSIVTFYGDSNQVLAKGNYKKLRVLLTKEDNINMVRIKGFVDYSKKK